VSTTLIYRKPFIEWGTAAQPIPGQPVSGDLHLVKTFGHGALAAVVDGLGHGDEATVAAKTAVAVLEQNADQSVITLVKRCHDALIKTRGAVITVASFNVLDSSVSWLSVGNVEGFFLRSDTKATPPSESAFLRAGVVGYQLPALRASVIAVSPGDVLVLATDGIRSGFEQSVILTDTAQQIADRVMGQHFKGIDDALVLVVRFLGTRHE
jgi:serine/threonine protein phosphatase PrpC